MIYSEQNDETLVALTLIGETKAYETLVERWQRAVTASAYSVVQNSYIAEDAAQDAFVSAWLKLDTLREPAKFSSWVCRISKNCAKNILVRFRQYLDFDTFTGSELNNHENPEDFIAIAEDTMMLNGSIDKLPQKVKEIITLYYFNGLSIAEIADFLHIPVGTVKWQLHEGREKLRKDLCAMNENECDILTQKVMKKVEELKHWKFKNSKAGFIDTYKEVLENVEKLPESIDKDYTLADVLMCGWWWLPGEKNAALFARMKELAIAGKNDDVLQCILSLENEKLSGNARIEFMLHKQIPWLEAKGFVKSLGFEWFWLGHEYFTAGDSKAGFKAYNKVLSVLKSSDLYYAAALSAIKLEKKMAEKFKNMDQSLYALLAISEEYTLIDGVIRIGNQPGYARGEYIAESNFTPAPAAQCDGYLFIENTKPGHTVSGSGGDTLTYLESGVTVETPCGIFKGCELWETCKRSLRIKTYYKNGVGMVKQEIHANDDIDVKILKSYHIEGGKGLLPCHTGNSWMYTGNNNPAKLNVDIEYKMIYADKKYVTAACFCLYERLAYDENSWWDMAHQVRNDYVRFENGQVILHDVSQPMKRMEELAATSIQKAHTRAACAVMRRIFSTNDRPCWNFFHRCGIIKSSGETQVFRSRKYSFEWKDMSDTGDANYLLACNHMLFILQDGAGCIWSENWVPGLERTLGRDLYDTFTTKLKCSSAGKIRTSAGTFDNCICVMLDIDLNIRCLTYRGGKKEYYFAPGIGIVRVVNHNKDKGIKAIYELTSYSGVGEGYMPVADGLMRHYDALGLPDGYKAFAELTYCADNHGNVVLFENLGGMKRKI